jgi:adenylate kinase family enzyme
MAEKLANTVVHLIGAAGTGKFTIAKELARQANFRVIDNHLVSNPVFSVMDLDGKAPIPQQAREYTDKIWQVVFDSLLHLAPEDFNFIFTNVLLEGEANDRKRFEDIRGCARERGSRYFPVRLVISDVEEHKKRITGDDRAERMKTTDPVMAEKAATKTVLTVDDPLLLNLDVTSLSPEEATQRILQHIDKMI